VSIDKLTEDNGLHAIAMHVLGNIQNSVLTKVKSNVCMQSLAFHLFNALQSTVDTPKDEICHEVDFSHL